MSDGDAPPNIVNSGWYNLLAPTPKPEIWDLCVGNGQHLAWDRCWAFVLTHNLGSRELSIVWAIAYAVKTACEDTFQARLQRAYEQGWRDACDDHLQQQGTREQAGDPTHPIGARYQRPYVEVD